ncbi:hypothetical protein [Alkalisalibacterium limincola]|uniref:Uncharacterized protein n=1 Tax=Alkalisalibacterium limincola TaxID=2699169 RepID=A0A5C8KIF5_9GAMM|nr:hypothetical protein [Alkalisalibacterium limincola]TXK59073.1 hypothetical protein FU658_14100 [Alkalisalibacterium limincola]
MRNVMLSALVAFGVGAASPTSASAERPPELNCQAGPIEKSYGGGSWLVYACDDNRSAVVVSAQDNPATPFYFILYVSPDGEIRLYGEGNGARSATQPAFNELSNLDQAGVATLVAEASAAKELP